jgi:iron complex transport system ATP-binding protein
MAEALFKIQSLTFGYAESALFKGLDLELMPGCFHAVLGPNGSGKTTLMDLFMGNLAPRAGKVSLLGRDVGRLPRRDLARLVALVPPSFAVDFPFSVEEVVLMGRHPHIPRFASPNPADWRAVENALERMDLMGLAHKAVNRLSSGEKQRVALARALAQDTPVLLLDEPTANLDIKHAIRALTLLKRQVREKDKSVVAVLHDLNLAAGFADQVICLKKGRVLAFGPAEKALNQQLLRDAFGVEAKVEFDAFAGARTVVYKQEALA